VFALAIGASTDGNGFTAASVRRQSARPTEPHEGSKLSGAGGQP